MASSTVSLAPGTDLDLVQAIAQGAEHAVGTLYDRYGPSMFCLARRILGEDADAEEAVLDSFSQVWRQAGRFDPNRGSVAAWLMMMVRSRALDLHRAQARRQRHTTTAAQGEPDVSPAMGSWQTDPERALQADEQRREVRAAVGTLPTDQRQAIELAFYGGLSQSEIAKELDTPLGTIKTRIRAGMQKLRDSLRSHLPEHDHE